VLSISIVLFISCRLGNKLTYWAVEMNALRISVMPARSGRVLKSLDDEDEDADSLVALSLCTYRWGDAVLTS
jgi:hypothetical protein